MEIVGRLVQGSLGIAHLSMGIGIWSAVHRKHRWFPYGNWVYIFAGNVLFLAGLYRITKAGRIHVDGNALSWMILGGLLSGLIAVVLILVERMTAQKQHRRDAKKVSTG